ncbi:MAG: protoporphyrinogen oxidase [Planctomycetota bacterium]
MKELLDVAVVGAGPAGLGTAHFARKRGLRTAVFEAGPKPGGKIQTRREDGFVIESGPQAWEDREPALKEVVRDLELEPLRANPASSSRYLLLNGRLHAVPMGPVSFLASPILSVRAKLRLLGEPFRRGRKDREDESVHDFAARRLGPEVARILVDAIVSGIYAGDTTRISAGAAFPMLVELEREHGSLVRGMIARRKAARRSPEPKDGQPELTRALYSFAGGMGDLVAALARELGAALHLSSPVARLRREGEAWVLEGSGSELGRAREVVLSTPARTTAAILAPLCPELEGMAARFPVNGMATVMAAFPRSRVAHPCSGFGFLAPRCEGFAPLGVVFVHDIFPRHVPEGFVALRVMLGGAHDPDVAGLSDEELVDKALGSVRLLLGLRGEPARVWTGRVPHAVPQYTLGHLERVARFEAGVARWEGLHLAGDSFFGVGVLPAFRRAAEVAGQFRSGKG